MCEDERHRSWQPSRRSFLRYAASAAALAALPEWAWSRMTVVEGASGLVPVSMAMHIHSSFSEQYGSMDAHLFQAQLNQVDVIWWTDHDYRMSGTGYRKTVHFTSLTAETPAAGEGKPWTWVKHRSGSLSSASGGGIVATPASPLDPVTKGSLRVTAASTDGQVASLGYYAESHPSDWNYHCTLLGQTLSIEVLPTSIGPNAYLEVLVGSSLHPASGGRPAGTYGISYRIGGPGTPGSRTASGLTGVVTLAGRPGTWNSIVLNPDQDIAALWPDLDVRDFGLFAITLSAVSTGGVARGYFDYLRFARSSGAVELATQVQMEASYQPLYPAVTQYQGLEVSLFLPHVNWFGNGVSLPDYSTMTPSAFPSFLASALVPSIHANAGLASYNHPYGATYGALLSPATQDQLLRTVASQLLGNAALGCDLLEVGYPQRAGVDLAHHAGLWDVCSRNALFLTGNGVSDDHFGADWLDLSNNWLTSVWAASSAQADLLAGLAAGRAWMGSLSAFRGTLDMLVDGTCPMGSASVSNLPARSLSVMATGLPAGSSLQVLRGLVDYAGTAAPFPNTTTIASYDSSALAGGSVALSVDTTEPCFVRSQVVDATGTVIAMSNPAWMLQAAPPNGIPSPRAC